jgi:hypothetical protein
MRVNITHSKLVRESEIRQRYSALMSQVAQPYTQTERETWFTQLKEADAFILDNNAVTPLLSAMATARGISISLLATKIKENDALFCQVIGDLLGQQQAELDRLILSANN